MAKSNSSTDKGRSNSDRSPNDQRSDVKNDNNSDYEKDRENTERQKSGK